MVAAKGGISGCVRVDQPRKPGEEIWHEILLCRDDTKPV